MISAATPRVNETNQTQKSGVPAGRTRRRGSMARRGLAAAAVAMLALMGTATAASAHDSLVSSTPVANSTVAQVPQQITMTMSDTPIALGSQVKILDSTGTDWSDGPVQILDSVVTEVIKPGAPAGKYTVESVVVASDGHPLDRTFTFTATKGGNGQAAVAGPSTPLQSTTQADPAAAPSTPAVPWSVIGMIGVLVVLVIILAVYAKRKLSADD